ncbi:MAG: hypothetical protein WC520_00245 [Candidatus Paceibacterota bacterium]
MDIDIIVPGCTRIPKKRAELLSKNLKKCGREAVVIDIFYELRSWFFQKTLLTSKDHTFLIKSFEAQLKELNDDEVRTLFTHSYGVIAILAPSLKAEEYILIAPTLDRIHWKWIERLFRFLPGFREMRNGTLSNELFEKLSSLKESGAKITFVIGYDDWRRGDAMVVGGYHGDKRVSYSWDTLEKMSKLGEVVALHDAEHRQLMCEKNFVETIIEKSKF